MIQELLGGAGLIAGERKLPINGGSLLEGSPSPSLSPSSSTTTTSENQNQNQNQNLRCPRCDSSNTKFCYYNNYNLTQPRHFCKTCRRYWTKGGALRNVPIGGGCRKNKSAGVSASIGKSAGGSATGKVRLLSAEIGKSGMGSGFDQDIPSNPILWAPPQNSHVLALLRATQNPNPNAHNVTNSVGMKEEGLMIGSHLAPESVASSSLSARSLGLDPLCQVPSYWRTNQHQSQHHHHQQNGFILGEAQSSGIQELHQRLRTSANYYGVDHSPAVLSNAASSLNPSVLESAPVAGGELGYWNPALLWSDLPTTNGAYPN